MSTLRVFGLDGCVKRYIHLTLNLLMEQNILTLVLFALVSCRACRAHHSSPRQKKKVYDSAAEVSPLTQQDCPAENKAHDVE